MCIEGAVSNDGIFHSTSTATCDDIFLHDTKETGLFVVIIITLFATYAPRTPNVIQTDKRSGVKRKKRKEAA